MLFNSPEFLVFLPIVFGLYWFVTHRHLRAQNLLLLVASYIFYGWWDWRFLGLIALSTHKKTLSITEDLKSATVAPIGKRRPPSDSQ